MTANATTESRLASLLTRSRPRFWLYLAGPVLVGVAFGAERVPDLLTPRTVILFAYFLVPANVLLYGVNDVFDRDIDEWNPKKDGREIRYDGGVLLPASVIASFLLGLALLPLTPRIARPYLVGFLLLGVAYSAPPLRLKTTPPLDSISNGLYVLPGAAAYATVAGANPPLAALVGVWFWAMAMHTFSAVPDIEPDRAAGVHTTATVLGETRTLAYCAVCWLLAAAGFALVDWRLGVLLFVYPLLVAGVYWSDTDVSRAYWWYPAINALVGMLLTVGGLTRVVPPGAVLP